jgi:proteasome assembly chaperone 2
VSTPLDGIPKLPIPVYSSPVAQHPRETFKHEGEVPFIPGGGLTRRILSSIPSSWSVPTAALLQFVIEGDNRADANIFASVVSKVLGANVKEWKQPASWNQGLFGSPHDQTLYY